MFVKTLDGIDNSQWGVGANLRRTDCFNACLEDAREMLGLLRLTIDEITRVSVIMQNDVGQTCEQGAELGLMFGINCVVHDHTTADDLKAQIDLGYAVIILVAYRFITSRLDQKDNQAGRDGHFILVTGYVLDDSGKLIAFICQDPDYWQPFVAKGHDVHYPADQVMQSITNSPQPGRCVFVQGLVKAELDYLAHTPNFRVNLHLTANGTVVDVLAPNSAVTVLKTIQQTLGGYTWLWVKAGNKIGWIVSAYALQQPTGYDISDNNNIDATTLMANTQFMIVKASGGTSPDARYAQRKQAIKALDPAYPLAAYHFGTSADVTQQVKVFLDTVQPNGDTVLILDFESDDPSPASTMSIHQAAQFVSAIKVTTGVWPTLYSRASFLDPLDTPANAADFAILRNCPLYVSNQHTPPVLPNGWDTWKINQYDQVGGLDFNRFNGTLDQMKAWWKANSPVLTDTQPPIQRIPPGAAYVTPQGDGLNLRAGQGKAFVSLAKLPALTPVTVLPDEPVEADTYTWVKVTALGKTGYVAQEYLKAGNLPATISPTPKPQPPTNYKHRLGPHLMGYLTPAEITAVNGYGVYKGMADGAVDQVANLQTLHTNNPTAIFIHRDYVAHNQWGNPEAFIAANGGVDNAVKVWIDNQRHYLESLPFAYHESFNEAGMGDAYLAFEAERVRQLHALGYKACVLNIAGGTADSANWQRAKMTGLLQAINDCEALIGVHCYGEGILSSNVGGSYWGKDGHWQGDMFPTSVPLAPDGNYDAWLGLRVLRYAHDTVKLGFPNVRFVCTELGLDDCWSPDNGVNRPFGVKTNGWKTCISPWVEMGWLNGMTADKFYRKQLEWWSTIIAATPQIVGGTVFTYGDSSGEWGAFDVKGLL